jgi:hypothetical protein
MSVRRTQFLALLILCAELSADSPLTTASRWSNCFMEVVEPARLMRARAMTESYNYGGYYAVRTMSFNDDAAAVVLAALCSANMCHRHPRQFARCVWSGPLVLRVLFACCRALFSVVAGLNKCRKGRLRPLAKPEPHDPSTSKWIGSIRSIASSSSLGAVNFKKSFQGFDLPVYLSSRLP